MSRRIDFDAEKFAQIVVNRWEEKIAMMRIGHSRDLVNTFAHTVITDTKGDPVLIQFIMQYYGRMVDMGVGSGVSMSNLHSHNTRRKPKKWYSKTLSHEIHRLAEILAEVYGRRATFIIKESIELKGS